MRCMKLQVKSMYNTRLWEPTIHEIAIVQAVQKRYLLARPMVAQFSTERHVLQSGRWNCLTKPDVIGGHQIFSDCPSSRRLVVA